MSNDTYTYYAGKKVLLRKREDEFVVRADLDEVKRAGLPDGEQVSSASTRVKTHPTSLEPLMARARLLAPTHHAYEVADSGEPFMITDRVIVKFKQEMPDTALASFAG